jgi:hypothetical protein
MTPKELMTLIGLWRYLRQNGSVFPEDVAVEVSSTTGKHFGGAKASSCLHSLWSKGLIKKGEWRHSYKLSKAGERLCDALKSMGLREEF